MDGSEMTRRSDLDAAAITRRDFLAQSGSCAAHLALAGDVHAARGATRRGHDAARRRRRARTVRQPREGQRRRLGVDFDAAQRRPTTVSNGGIIAGRNAVLAIEGFNQPRARRGSPARRASSRAVADARRAHALSLRSRQRRRGLSHRGRASDRAFHGAHARSRDRAKPAGRCIAHRRRRRTPCSSRRPTRRRSTSAGDTVRVVPRAGHTDSDVSLELDDPSIVFCGDLFWNAMFPNFVDAVPTKLSASVHALRRAEGHDVHPGPRRDRPASPSTTDTSRCSTKWSAARGKPTPPAHRPQTPARRSRFRRRSGNGSSSTSRWGRPPSMLGIRS